MTPQQRTLAIGTPIGVVVFLTYWAVVITRAATDGLPLNEVAWEGPWLLFVGTGATSYAIAFAFARYLGRGERAIDQRDRDIARLGGARDAELTGLAVLTCLILLALKVDTFWAANILFVGSYLGSLSSSLAQLNAYQEGIPNE
jgi:hypothetical protein